MRRPCLLVGTLLALRLTASAGPAGPSSAEGFRLEPRPYLDDVFGDTNGYRKTIDRFVTITEAMQARRDEFARAVQGTLVKLAPSPDGKIRPRGCPEAEVATPYARALKAGQEYLRAGRELTRHYEQVRELDKLGESIGLTPDYRWKVKRVIGQYQALLVDYREMKVAFHDQLHDELRYASCDLDKLLAKAEAAITAGAAKDEAWPVPGQPGAPGVIPPMTVEKALPVPPEAPPRKEPPVENVTTSSRSGIFIFIDNTRCPTTTRVVLDGKPLADVPGATRTAFQTTAGPHDLCLIAEGAPRRCGDPGTIRRSYLHEGWTISLRCD